MTHTAFLSTHFLKLYTEFYKKVGEKGLYLISLAIK